MKARYIALTDIYREPEDKQPEIDDVESMCRLLLYSNDIEIEGLIATTSFCYRKGGTEKERRVILDIIDAYEKVKCNLDRHAGGYPEADYLRSVTFSGIAEYGKKYGSGFGDERYNENPGVNHIIRVVDKKDPRPVWFGLWGGANTLAQAVWKVWKTRTSQEFDKFLSKLRIYGISDQDKGGIWMRENFGDRLFYIVSPSAGNYPGAAAFMNATWQGISFDYFGGKKVRKGFQGADSELVSAKWIQEHICGSTPYRKIYPLPTMSMEGDTPSYLGLIPNGLNDPEHPNWGGWGGRYEFYIPEKAPFLGKKEKFPIWTNASDTVANGNGGSTTNNYATIWRWRSAFQNDFLARLCWTEEPDFEKASHAPVVRLEGPAKRTVRCGEKVMLSGKESFDPNGKKLSYHWFHYKEAGDCQRIIHLEHEYQETAFFTAPDDPCTLHMILEVTNDGKPPVTRYARAIVEVRN